MPTYLKLGYPHRVTDKTGVHNVFMYLGPYATMLSMRPSIGTTWQGYPVSRTEVYPLEDKSGQGELVVEVETPDSALDDGADGDGSEPATPTTPPDPDDNAGEVPTDEYPYYEVESVAIEKQLRQHPWFDELTPDDWNAIELWEKETDGTARAAFQYWVRDNEGNPVGSIQTLTDDAQDYAKLRLLGIEAYNDYAPNFRKTSLFYGAAAPSTGDIGQKGSAPSNAPAGYEWIKTNDAARKQGAGKYWTRVEEWQGARLILVDKDDILPAVSNEDSSSS